MFILGRLIGFGLCDQMAVITACVVFRPREQKLLVTSCVVCRLYGLWEPVATCEVVGLCDLKGSLRPVWSSVCVARGS